MATEVASASGAQGERDPQPRRLHLVGRRPAAGRLQAVRVRQGHPAADGAPPPRLRARADQGRRSSSGTSSSQGRIENVEPGPAGGGRASSSTTPSPLDFTKLLDDPGQIADNLRAYIAGFSTAARGRHRQVRLRRPDRPAATRRTSSTRSIGKFADIDLHPDAVSNLEMGYLYEELIRRFSELRTRRPASTSPRARSSG